MAAKTDDNASNLTKNYSTSQTLPVPIPSKKEKMAGLIRNPKTWLAYLKKSTTSTKKSPPETETYTGLQTTETEMQQDDQDGDLLRIFMTTGIGHFLVGAIGVILLAALGATATGGVLTGWAFCCAITSFVCYASLKWIHEPQKSRFLPKLTSSQLKGYIKIYILMTVAVAILGAATAIHGAVVLYQYVGASPFYVFNGFIQFIPTFLYVGLGAGNLGLGIAALVIEPILLRKLYQYLAELRRNNPTVKTSVAQYKEEATPTDQFARVPHDEFFDCASPPPSYHSELKEEMGSEFFNDVQFAYSTYAQYIDVPVEDQWSTSSGLQRMETKL